MQITNPKFVLAQGNFFYNTHAVLTGNRIQGLVMRENIYSMDQYGGNQSIVLASTGAVTCSAVVVEDDINGQQNSQPVTILQTSATQSLYQKSSTEWGFDFSSRLVFSEIDQIEYSVTLDQDSPLVMHAA